MSFFCWIILDIIYKNTLKKHIHNITTLFFCDKKKPEITGILLAVQVTLTWRSQLPALEIPEISSKKKRGDLIWGTESSLICIMYIYIYINIYTYIYIYTQYIYMCIYGSYNHTHCICYTWIENCYTLHISHKISLIYGIQTMKNHLNKTIQAPRPWRDWRSVHHCLQGLGLEKCQGATVTYSKQKPGNCIDVLIIHLSQQNNHIFSDCSK